MYPYYQVFIENVSDCDLHYKLFYRIIFQLDTGGVKNTKKTISRHVIPFVTPTGDVNDGQEGSMFEGKNLNLVRYSVVLCYGGGGGVVEGGRIDDECGVEGRKGNT